MADRNEHRRFGDDIPDPVRHPPRPEIHMLPIDAKLDEPMRSGDCVSHLIASDRLAYEMMETLRAKHIEMARQKLV